MVIRSSSGVLICVVAPRDEDGLAAVHEIGRVRVAVQVRAAAHVLTGEPRTGRPVELRGEGGRRRERQAADEQHEPARPVDGRVLERVQEVAVGVSGCRRRCGAGRRRPARCRPPATLARISSTIGSIPASTTLYWTYSVSPSGRTSHHRVSVLATEPERRARGEADRLAAVPRDVVVGQDRLDDQIARRAGRVLQGEGRGTWLVDDADAGQELTDPQVERTVREQVGRVVAGRERVGEGQDLGDRPALDGDDPRPDGRLVWRAGPRDDETLAGTATG